MYKKVLAPYYSPTEVKVLRSSKIPYVLDPEYWHDRRLSVTLVSPEFSTVGIRSGGIADAVGNLAETLAKKGVDTEVVVPYHRSVKPYLFRNHIHELNKSDDLNALLQRNVLWRETKYYQEGHELSAQRFPLTDNLTCTLITTKDQEYFGHAKSLYAGAQVKDGPSDSERFMLFDWGAAGYLNLRAEHYGSPTHVVHLNDWSCGLVPFFEKLLDSGTNTPTMFSLHNIYNNSVDMNTFDVLAGHIADQGYGFAYNPMDRGGFHVNNRMDLLAAGLKWADYVMTVSPRYHAELLQSPAFAKAYYPILQMLESEHIFDGIVNGYNPDFEIDAVLRDIPDAQRFALDTIEDVREAKKYMKLRMQTTCGLEVNDQAMLIGFINRWDDQKSYKETIQAMRSVMKGADGKNVQFVVTGTMITPEDLAKKAFFLELQREFPGRVAVMPYSDGLARKLNPAIDLLLMPSKYEPCGISQLNCYATATPTLANRVGGLSDTIIDDGNIVNQTGFLFDGMNEDGTIDPQRFQQLFNERLRMAVQTYAKQPSQWNKVVENSYEKRKEYTWDAVAEKYLYWYGYMLARRMWAAYRDHLDPVIAGHYYKPDWILPERMVG